MLLIGTGNRNCKMNITYKIFLLLMIPILISTSKDLITCVDWYLGCFLDLWTLTVKVAQSLFDTFIRATPLEVWLCTFILRVLCYYVWKITIVKMHSREAYLITDRHVGTGCLIVIQNYLYFNRFRVRTMHYIVSKLG